MRLPDGYHFSPTGLYFKEHLISNFVVRPRVLYRRQGESFPFAADLEVLHGTSASPFVKKVMLQDLSEKWWKNPPPGCWYAPDRRYPARDLEIIFQNFISEMSSETPVLEAIQASEIGWLKLPSGRFVYVTGDNVIGTLGEGENVWPPEDVEALVFEQEAGCTIEAALSYFWELYGLFPGLTDMLLVYTLSSFLSPLFRKAGLVSRFPIILEGPTESKKTTLACLACGAFRRRDNLRSCVAGLTSTRYALELRAGKMRHATLIVDDLFPDGGYAQQAKALNFIRDLANQDPREAKSGKSVTGVKMDCGVVITAESFPECERSTRTRCLRLKLKGPIPNDTIYPFQQHPARLTLMFEEFIWRVAARYPAFVDRITSDFNDYRIRRSQDTSHTVPSERLAEIGFFLYESLHILLLIFPRKDSKDILSQFQKYINEWIMWQLSPDAAPGLRGNIAATIPLLYRKYPGAFLGHHGCWCIGLEDLCDLLRNELRDESIDQLSVTSLLRRKGALLMDKSGAATKKLKGRRLLHIIPERL